jgi:hypothetical protein
MLRRLIALAAAPALAASFAASAVAGGPLRTAVVEPFDYTLETAPLIFSRIHGAGASMSRVSLSWYSIAPKELPAQFDPSNPFDPAYDWRKTDANIQAAFAAGVEPYFIVDDAPVWARLDDKKAGSPPNPADLGSFMHAAAERYSGRYPGLPRIRYWQVWIEPNVNKFFRHQFENGKLLAPKRYASMVNAVADAVHSSRADNKVIAGGLSPFTVSRGKTKTITPMVFMQDMLCMKANEKPRRSCSRRVRFDIWSHHPFTSGGPTHRAYNKGDISLGDLPVMKAMLSAAYRSGHILSRGKPGFWVTEFSWDTNPPDPKALPMKLASRWTAEALYVMWKVGVSLVTWLDIRDNPYPQNATQSGLYLRGATIEQDKPKQILTAFRFPFVAYARKGGIFVWGRTPWGKPGRVVVSQSSTGRWKQRGSLTANASGIFSGMIKGTRTGVLRAQLAGGGKASGGKSLSFSLKRPPDRLIPIFGSGGNG